MKIKIISDSTCDLTPELIAQHDISIVPLIVMKNDEEYLDGATITPADIFAHVAAGGDLCKTAALGVGVYQDLFEQYAKEYDAVIHISLGSGFSSSYQNACLAAEEFENVYVVDSRNLSTGHGLMVLKAAELAEKWYKEGMSTVAVIARSHKQLKKMADKYGIPQTYTDYHDILNDVSIDAVSIATPTFTHKQIALEAIKSQKHVLCEKTPALNADEVKEIREA